MFNVPLPPPPPKLNNQVLNQLADYYRQLLDYHQQAAVLAAQQLAHIEALLNPSLTPDFSAIHPDFNSKNEAQSLKDITPLLELPSSDILKQKEDLNSLTQKAGTARDELTQLLESNRGKILHIEYIVRKLYGKVPSQDLEKVTQATKKQLEEGAKQKKWYAMPDSPECWTIDLKEFPDVQKSNKIGSKSQKSNHLPYNSRLPYSNKLAQYETTTEAIKACLQEHHPKSITTTQVLQWLYPEGISEGLKKKAAEAINNILSKGVGLKGWQRVALGQYLWTE